MTIMLQQLKAKILLNFLPQFVSIETFEERFQQLTKITIC